jgi:hypothetical protein
LVVRCVRSMLQPRRLKARINTSSSRHGCLRVHSALRV